MDTEMYLALIGAVVAGLLAVWVPVYFFVTVRLGRWFLNNWRTKVRAVRPRGRSAFVRCASQGLEIAALSTWRICAITYGSVILGFVVPILLAIAALEVAFSVVRPR